MTAARRRLDERLVADGLAADLPAARHLVGAGGVLVDGAPARSPARLVGPQARVEVHRAPRFVSRGGEKLDGVLEALGIDVTGGRVLDVGASTGGFTDCLLSRGAARVVALDVGRHQLHERLRADPRVVDRSPVNVLDATPAAVRAELGGEPDLVTVDVSFTSVARLAPTLVALAPRGRLLVLVKPQFEADYETVSRGRGVVADPAVWRAALERCASAIEDAGAGIIDVVASPLPGASGNREFFVLAATGVAGTGPERVAALVEHAVAAAP